MTEKQILKKIDNMGKQVDKLKREVYRQLKLRKKSKKRPLKR
jgi:uncharacterized protein Yka (UPF0111/DUF47 family)